MFDWITSTDAWIAFFTLTALEVVLGIDNVIFITILAERLPPERRPAARRIGLLLAMLSRIALLFSLSLIMRMKETLFTVLEREISGRDVVLILGGLFLIGKSTREIHHKIELANSPEERTPKVATFGAVIMQILILDLVFSLDSVITAVGMVDEIGIMIAAVIVAVVVMVTFVNAIARFVERNPTFKVLALSFLILIGVALLGDGLDFHIPKGYVYFAMAFSVAVEMVNLRITRGTRRSSATRS
ncbi:MAG: TerC family protein [Planctomycetota bacterium]